MSKPLLPPIEEDGPVKYRPSTVHTSAIVAGGAYCLASMSMVLLNKTVLSSFGFRSPNWLLWFQCATCVLLSRAMHATGRIRLEPVTRELARAWAPANAMFVAMIASSFMALRWLSVPMVTVLKNLTNLFVICGDYAFYGKSYGPGVWATLGIMVLSALAGAATDLEFNAAGYAWQAVNCLFTAGYSLALKGAMERVKAVTTNGERLGELSMVYLNNLLSLLPVAVIALALRETPWDEPALRNPAFVVAATCSALVGFGISFASLWFLSTVTATTYSLVGSLNKLPLALVALLLFDAPWTPQNLGSVVLGVAAGVVFGMAKKKA